MERIAVIIPLALTTLLVTVLFGQPDLTVVVALGASLITVPALFVGIALAAATIVPSQAAVAAIGLTLLAAPPIVGGILPPLTPFFPTSIFEWAVQVSTGGPASPVTPVAWVAGLVALFVLARRRLNAMDL